MKHYRVWFNSFLSIRMNMPLTISSLSTPFVDLNLHLEMDLVIRFIVLRFSIYFPILVLPSYFSSFIFKKNFISTVAGSDLRVWPEKTYTSEYSGYICYCFLAIIDVCSLSRFSESSFYIIECLLRHRMAQVTKLILIQLPIPGAH